MNSRLQAFRANRTNEASEGFTLIELLIVIVVLGILAAVVVFALGSVTGNAKAAACNSDAKSLLTAVQAYNAQNSPSSITAEQTTTATYDVTMSFTSFWAIGASVKDTATGGTIVNAVVNGNGGVSSNHFMTLNGSAITVGMSLTIGGSGTGTVLAVTPGTTGSGITVGVPSTYSAAGTQGALLVSAGYLNSWPSSSNTYSLSLSTTQAGHVMVYFPATSTTGVDYSSETSTNGCNSL